MEENKIYCSHCGELIGTDDYDLIGDEPICSDCVNNFTTTCDYCGEIIWDCDSFGDEYTHLCSHCYDNYYTRCCNCDALLYEDDVYNLDGYDYCHDCYEEERDKCSHIHEYSYKPEPKFYGKYDRYFGVELEIDGAGKDDENAEEILDIANNSDDCLYIKSDGSLEEGMELVSHPMSLDYHKSYCWEDIMRKAIRLGYRSHNTSTCGLHVHVNRDCMGKTREDQEEVISRILFFVEKNWNELLKFSRRSEYAMNRWAARYGFEKTGREILDKAKKGNNGRYAAVNLCNYSTIEFRLFRGTLKYNTFIATLELVNLIVETAIYSSEDELQKLSWSEFVSRITEPELITYLKERNLYINEKVTIEQEEV